MHLKNYSLYSPDGDSVVLSPAYDLLSTKLLMPENKEELALTVCGKKRKLKREHFVTGMEGSGLTPKVIDRTFSKIENAFPRMLQLISESFLPQEMQSGFSEIIKTNLEALS